MPEETIMLNLHTGLHLKKLGKILYINYLVPDHMGINTITVYYLFLPLVTPPFCVYEVITAVFT